ncbi:MAG: hypothetical protein LBO74_17775 [Candidatus Symbiothrix sp.]|jgi:hypothetical protein|nr:hypothetical protein [Candidatus Symbiothrix sp.]
MVIRKETKNLGNILVKFVSKELAKEMTVKNHYSHKWNDGSFGKYNFGIFKEENPDKCLGVAVYGYMKNPKAKLFTHPNPKAWMCELNRMWIDDCLGHNSETLLIAASLKLLRQADKNIVAVQSFADGRLGCGTIYKAANFKYYGYHHTRFLENIRTGEFIHEQILTNTTSVSGYLRSNISYLIGDLKTYQVKTYRYIYPFCKHFKFKHPELSYPEYNKGMNTIEWVRNTTSIKDNITYLLQKI